MIALLVIFKKDTQLKYPHIKVIYHNIFKLFSVLFFPLLPTLVVPQTFVRVKCEKVKFLLRKYLNSVSIFEDNHIFLKILQVCSNANTCTYSVHWLLFLCVFSNRKKVWKRQEQWQELCTVIVSYLVNRLF